MPFRIATRPGNSDRDNEDFAAATDRTAVLLDGVSGRPGDGCVHGVAWYTRRLGALLLAGVESGAPLREALAGAIEQASSLHADTCDLTRQETPSATVVAARINGDRFEYLVLSDSVLVVAGREGARLLAETRLDDLRAELARAPYETEPGTPARAEEEHRRRHTIRAYRNVDGGFWTAGADPRAAGAAVSGSLPLDGVLGFVAMTDGASRAVDVFGAHDWDSAAGLALKSGPLALIDQVRSLEADDPDGLRYPRGKRSDDATVLTWEPGSGQG
ncbi:hypothetical protein IDM40_05745 [Nocardiopsis sp. HNM0947]|uniref:Protein phosphatase 2C n=1 Tax=Nocardiopsis coralli TaxID=2772213 RepID=A0ABR9P2Z2_9ACTN|nr:hypothetical protein [Nocardiopsis coralli]MBE2998209.1 hypothetical protein [Nocardiopsis coralli]